MDEVKNLGKRVVCSKCDTEAAVDYPVLEFRADVECPNCGRKGEIHIKKKEIGASQGFLVLDK